MTNTNVVQWIVEQVHPDGARNTQSFNTYDEALDMYNHTKELYKESFVSIQKTEKKLLVE